MKIIITAKTKSHNPSEKEIDKTVDEVMNVANKIKGKIIGKKCFCDGTSIIIER
jgi:hypothetical protein